MDVAIVVAIISAIEALGVAVIGAMVSSTNKRNEAYRNEREKREALREDRDTHLYDLTFATAVGTEVLLHQAHGDNLNGNVDDALRGIQKAKAACNHTFNRQAAKL